MTAKPWEEEWSVGGPDGTELHHGEGGSSCVEFGPEEQEAVALAAAAPDLYRALKAVEWDGLRCGSPCCPSCEAYYVPGNHEPDCTLNAALKKARGER